MYKRAIKELISSKLFKGKVIVIVGPRRVGKTTLSDEIIKETGSQEQVAGFNGDNPTDRDKLNNRDFEFLDNLIGDKRIVFIDEAQKVGTIGQTLKLMVDQYGETKQIIATGSSSINLLDKTSEPLTGRKYVFRLYPLSIGEIYPDKNQLQIAKNLEALLVYGNYPEVINAKGEKDKQDALRELSSSYLYKDILEFQEIRNPEILTSLLKALALQVGSEVSYNELSNILGIDKKTAERYVDLLEKNYIIFRLPPFSKNQRRAISKLRKIYFYDLGVRNAVINNFNYLADRADTGALWENFSISERIKFLEYHEHFPNKYFLRTYDGAEIDLIEEEGGKISGYEFKFSSKKTGKASGKAAGINYKIIHQENITEFL